ncbi:MAG: sulfite exporter TauE/SafE family protein [Phycisphaerae bacterium]
MLAWAVIVLSITFIGVAKSGFGGGLGLLVVPATALAMGYTSYGSEAALGFLLPLLIVGDALAVGKWHKQVDFSLLKRLMLPAILGVVLGSGLLWWFHKQEALLAALIRLEIGVECILLVSISWWRQYRGVQEKTMREPARSILTGAFAGVSTTLAHAAGPIIAMYLLPLKLSRQAFVATSVGFFFVMNYLKLPGYWYAGMFQQVPWGIALAFVPLVFVGTVIGVWANTRMSDALFTKVVYVVTFGLGWYLLADGAWRLFRYWSV